MISDKTTRLSMVNNQRVLYNNTNYILKGALLGVTSWSRSLFITAKFIFGECCHTVGSTRLDINISSVITAHKNRKLNVNDSRATRIILC